MGLKRKIKNKIKFCLICSKKFKNYKEKYIHRINPYKKIKISNVIVLCNDCKNKIMKNIINIYNIKYDKEQLNDYFINFKKYFKYIFINKIRSKNSE